ncbi:hotosynthetic electron transport chain [Populus alba x Populus x berolinensis]|nr:hotosynthetic electron transport chain [Populus alba x Populus x berolinensis]
MVEDAQGNEVPIQRLADSIAGPFVYSVMTISAVTFSFWYYTGSHFFPDVLLNDIAGLDGDPLLLSLKLSVDVLTRTLTEGKPAVSAVSSISYEESEILQMADAVEKIALHPIARAIVNKAESLKLTIPVTRGQLTEPGFGTLAEVDGSLVAVGSLDWVQERFQRRTSMSDLKDLETEVMYQSSEGMSSSSYSKTVVYVGREGEGIIGAIAISNGLCHDAESTVTR